MTWNNLWHLHYTLVLPIFVVVRELLRVAAEKFRGWPMTPEQLDRSRRMCGVIAALLFTGGLALATIVDVSFGLQFVDIVQVQWQRWRLRRSVMRG